MGFSLCTVWNKILQKVLIWVRTMIFYEFIKSGLFSTQPRARLVMSNKDIIIVSFEVKRSGVDINSISIACQ